MAPFDTFLVAMHRADHLLVIYDLLHDQRQRGVRQDWADKFRGLMRWPKNEAFERVDGKAGNSILILRKATGLDRDKFQHEYLEELLRATVVATVSALDRYMHDIVVHHSWALLGQAEAKVPKELKNLQIPVLAAKHAVDRLRKDDTARPGGLIKEAIRNELHREFTFQKPDDVQRAAKMLGINDFWRLVAAKMPGHPTNEAVIKALREIVHRRNQIVHEADVVRKAKAKQITMRAISATTAGEWAKWMRDLVGAIDDVVKTSLA